MDTTTDSSPDQLRAAMVGRILTLRPNLDGRVEHVMRTTPRHVFVPEASVEEAYAEQAVITHRAADGTHLSCASGPRIVAGMLDQLGVRPGDSVAEIGAGTGYNARLLDQLVGSGGHVVTIDIDADVTAKARHALDATGGERVTVVTGDGAFGDAEHGPYDKIIAAVASWDVPAAWWDQLKPGGRLVVPLRWRGQTRAVAFAYDGKRLMSDSVDLCGFVPMVGQDAERAAMIDAGGHVALHWDADQAVDPEALSGVLSLPKVRSWSGVTVRGDESFDGVWIRLTAVEPDVCRIAADKEAVAGGLCTPAIPARSPALVDGGSLAYFVFRRKEQEGVAARWELGAAGHGPVGQELADRMCEHIRVWSGDRDAQPVITAYRTGAEPGGLPADGVVRKRDTTLVIAF